MELSGYKPVVLVVLDGFGVPQERISPFFEAKRDTFEELEKFFPFTTLQASGVAVGLEWGEEGNSEVGHLTMGAGKAIFHHLPRISLSIQDGTFFENEALNKAAGHVMKFGSKLHIIGLFSSGSVHAFPDHLYGLLEFSKRKGLPNVWLHLFTDGRDSPPKEAGTFFRELESRLSSKYPFAKIGSLVGRNFAMDRDLHWDKIEDVYNLLTLGQGKGFRNPIQHLESEYKRGFSDEFLEPSFLADEEGRALGRMQAGDAVIFYNYREDSARELTRAFVEEGFDAFPREKVRDLFFVTLTEYKKSFPVEVAFPPLEISSPLASVISENGLVQLHIAETEKYAHVTYFFNGWREEQYPGEERILIPSPVTAHFDEIPEMSASKITDAVIANLSEYSFILVNFANADMVGHTGNYDATRKAIEALDDSLSKIMARVLELGGVMVITGDHGNAEEKVYRVTGEKRTKHTANPVPFYLVGGEFRRREPRSPEEISAQYDWVGGVISDVAPTVLELLGLPVPEEMTGVSLLPKLLEK